MEEKVKTLVSLAESQIGGAYVFGAWGDLCTPGHRKTRAKIASAHSKTIYADCPVLSGKQETCDGCVHNGKIEADCRGFTDWLLRAAGVIDLYGDTVTTQYYTASNWDGSGGVVKDLPNTPCILFKKDGENRYSHTGFYDGNGFAIHAKGHASGIVKERIEETKFTHYKLPKGLYGDNTEGSYMNVLKVGSVGDDVEKLQTILNGLGYNCGNIDGKFGAITKHALMEYQLAYGLTIDGICGTQTWKALLVDADDSAKDANDNDASSNDHVDDDCVTRAEFNALVEKVAELENMVKQVVV